MSAEALQRFLKEFRKQSELKEMWRIAEKYGYYFSMFVVEDK